MNENQLLELIDKFGIARDQLLREEVEIAILDSLANHRLGTLVAFYGGTALRLAYGSPRFSEDIDLITVKPVTFSIFGDFISTLVKENDKWTLKDIKDKRQTMFALILIKDQKLKHNFSVKIEIHKPIKKINLDLELSLIKSPTSIFEPLLLVPTLEELKRLKIAAIMDRKKARDIFDLWYIDQSLKTNFVLPDKIPRFTEREFTNELKVFLPRKFHPIITQLYGKINR